MSVYRGRERILLSIHRPVQHRSFFLLSLPVLSGDGDVLKMLNAHCFHGDNTFMLYFLELFPLAEKLGALLYPFSFTQTAEMILYRPNKKKLNRSFHG